MRKTTFYGLAGAAGLFAASSGVWAIPLVIDDVTTAQTVHWKADGSPPLPWNKATSDQWNHNQLTPDPFDNFQKWMINKAWDNRTLHSSVEPLGPAQFGHGYIAADTPVRFGYDSTVPADAKPVIKAGFADWVTKATAQFNAKADPWDRLGMAFTEEAGTTYDISVKFVDSTTLDDAYAAFTPAKELLFIKDPTITVATSGGTKRIRKKDAATNDTSITIPTPWEYSGTPNRLPDVPIQFSDDSGTTWSDTAPAGFGDLTLIAGNTNTTTPAASANPLFVFEMDFKTIALHEIGHSMALGHANNDGIMKASIAQDASFGHTLGIDNLSALAVAVDYTYSVPEPATGAILALMGTVLMIRRRK